MIKFRVWDDIYKTYENKRGIITSTQFNNYMIGTYIKSKLELWTGLTDKNGVDIYVGDILKREDGRIGSVVFEDGELILYEDGTSLYWLIERVKNNIEEVFIIGNINENKEMLE